MNKILIFGCTPAAEFIVDRLIEVGGINEICIVDRDKAKCDEVKKKHTSTKIRITTARADLSNAEGTKMMLSITQPELIVNLAPAEYTMSVMKMALETGADYIDGNLYNCDGDLLSEQFSMFGQFRQKGNTAIAGCGLNPSLLTSLVRQALYESYDNITSADIFGLNLAVDEFVQGEAAVVKEGDVAKIDRLSCTLKLEFGETPEQILYPDDSPVVRDFLMEIPDIPNVRYFRSFEKNEEDDDDTELADKLGMLSDEPLEIADGISISPRQFWIKLKQSKKVEKKLAGFCAAGALIKGIKAGEEKTELIAVKNDNDKAMADYGMTGKQLFDAYAMLAGVVLLCNGRWKRPGVFTAAAFNPEIIMSEIKRHGLAVSEIVNPKAEVAES